MPGPAILCAALIRVCLGALFVAAGTSKLLRQPSIRRVITQYQLLPDAAVRPAAFTFAVVEAGVGTLLVLSLMVPVSSPAVIAAAALLCACSVAVVSALARGIVVPCRCAPFLNGHTVTWATVARNQVLLVLLVIAGVIGAGASP